MPLVMAMSVKRSLVTEFFTTALTFWGEMINFYLIFIPEEEFAPSAFSLLFLKEFSKRRLCQWVIFEPLGPVEQVTIKWAHLAFYLDVTLDGCRAMSSEGMPRCIIPWRCKCPGIPFHCSPILLFHPCSTFLRVFSGHLLPEHLHQEVVAKRELLAGNDRAILQRPTVNNRVELADELLLGEGLTLL
jgi:hypothetical protein